MISASNLVLLMLTHWLADFALQTQEQANNKWSNSWALISHVGTYGICMSLVLLYLMPGEFSIVCKLFACALLVSSHYCIDYVTSKITHKLYEEKSYHDFFVVIGFDQFLHLLTIIPFCGGV